MIGMQNNKIIIHGISSTEYSRGSKITFNRCEGCVKEYTLVSFLT